MGQKYANVGGPPRQEFQLWIGHFRGTKGQSGAFLPVSKCFVSTCGRMCRRLAFLPVYLSHSMFLWSEEYPTMSGRHRIPCSDVGSIVLVIVPKVQPDWFWLFPPQKHSGAVNPNQLALSIAANVMGPEFNLIFHCPAIITVTSWLWSVNQY